MSSHPSLTESQQPFAHAGGLKSRTFVGLLVAQFFAAFNDQAIHAAAMFFAINTMVLTERDAEYPITSLPPEEAKRLFRSYCDEKTAAFEALLERFLQAVGYNTLCIEIFSKTLREGAEWGLDFESLLQKLE